MPDDPHALTVIYNDECPVCRFEVEGHRRAAPATRFVPVRGADLRALGLTEEQALRRLHAVRGGEVLSGLDANRAMWAERPALRWLARLTGLPAVRPVAALLYDRAAAPLLYRMHLARGRRTRAARG
ncbi:thiol-disulfide oxidoreductase DCC family protein [Hasllibacter halocynthiae]|nr:DUF393 domain-containing protein [Hasllibacter halocynthiae]